MNVIGVLGGSGGVGASTFAAALALTGRDVVLVDGDPVGGGIDVLLGAEGEPGARWSALRLDGGRLDPTVLTEALPQWRGVPVLAADEPPDPAALVQVVCAVGAVGPVVLDLPREPGPLRTAALSCCRLCVLVAAARTPAMAAARATLPSGVAVGLVLRRGDHATIDAARVIGVPLLGVLSAPDGSDCGAQPPRAMLRVAAGVWDGARR